mmetsp:Transcript_53777/g.105173  ORF Transcript_53777/g.105173 Transcript_53777/m.105173 type:complete len:153 (+) Transcript_53777:364-822(+)
MTQGQMSAIAGLTTEMKGTQNKTLSANRMLRFLSPRFFHLFFSICPYPPFFASPSFQSAFRLLLSDTFPISLSISGKNVSPSLLSPVDSTAKQKSAFIQIKQPSNGNVTRKTEISRWPRLSVPTSSFEKTGGETEKGEEPGCMGEEPKCEKP